MVDVADLFSGIGGISLGLGRAGMTTKSFCEIDPYCRKVLSKHWPDVPIYEDVTKLKGADIGPVDIICGGFPCQDISCAGKGEGITGKRSGLWWEMHRIIDEVRPRWLLIENVPALRTRGADEVLGSLEGIGYTGWPLVVGADDVGAKHRRKRVWIVAHANGGRRNQGMQSAGRKEGRGADRCDQESCEVANTDSGRKLQQEGLEQKQRGWTSDGSGEVSDSDLKHDDVGRHGASEICRERSEATDICGGEQDVGNANCPSSDSRAKKSSPRETASEPGGWATEPDVGRVAHGVPSRVDRLRALGNSVVPQIPEMIGLAIMEIEAKNI